MRYIIYGAGAIGGSIGARLHLAGHDVILIARGAHYETIARDGLRYRNPEQDVHLPIAVVSHPTQIEFASDDVVFFTMKSQHTDQALDDLSAVAGTTTPVICCQNGVCNEAAALRYFANVYGMVVMLPATHVTPGEVLHFGTTPGGALDCGRYPTGTDTTISTVASDLTNAGFIARADQHAMRWKYAKLLMNLGNALQALCDGNTGELMRRARAEALACYQAAGIDCATADESRERYSGTRGGEIKGVARGGGSSWQSLARGTGNIETDYMNGEICYLGRLNGVATPVNEALQVLANRAVRERADPGSLTLREIEADIAARESNR